LCVLPRKFIMLTKDVYDIQLKKTEKNYWPCSPVVFSATFILLKDRKVTAYGVVCSIYKNLFLVVKVLNKK